MTAPKPSPTSVADIIPILYGMIEARGSDWEGSPLLSHVISWLIDEDQAGKKEEEAEVAIGGCRFSLDSNDPFCRSFLYGYQHEPIMLDVCKALCGDQSVIWDVGANFGFYAVQLAAHAGPSARVTAFEPGRRASHMLQRNIARNGLENRIAVAACALGVTDGHATFHEMDNSALSGLTDTGRSTATDTYDIHIRTMDEVWVEQGRPSLSLVKIDVEGHESDVLNGGEVALSESPDAILFCEMTRKNVSHEGENNLRKTLARYADKGWRILLPTAAGKLIDFAPNDFGIASAQKGDLLVMVREGSAREKALRRAWSQAHQARANRTPVDLTEALPALSRYVTHILGLRDGKHRRKIKDKDAEISSLTKALSSSTKGVALLQDKVRGLTIAVAEAQENASSRLTKEKNANAELARALTASRSAHEEDVALLQKKVEDLQQTVREAQARQIALIEARENADKLLVKEKNANAELTRALATSRSAHEQDIALLQKKVDQLQKTVGEAQAQKKTLDARLSERQALIKGFDDFLSENPVGRIGTLASSRLKGLAASAHHLLGENDPTSHPPPRPATTKNREGTTLGDSFERLAHHRLDIRHIISLGAGSGGDSVAIRNRYYPDASLLMIEAQEGHKKVLSTLCANKNNTDYIICAAAGQDGTVRFESSSPTGGAVVAVGNGTIDIPARSVDSLVQENKLAGPCFLKFDTHGVEIDILEGATKTLKHTSLIMMEVYNFKLNFVDRRNLTFDEMCAYLRERGFRCVDICDPLFRPNDRALWQAHLFFIRADHPLFHSNSYSAPDPFAS